MGKNNNNNNEIKARLDDLIDQKNKLVEQRAALQGRIRELEKLSESGHPRAGLYRLEAKELSKEFDDLAARQLRLEDAIFTEREQLRQAEIPLQVRRVEELARDYAPEMRAIIADIYTLLKRCEVLIGMRLELDWLRARLGDDNPEVKFYSRVEPGELWARFSSILAVIESGDPAVMDDLSIPSELQRVNIRAQALDKRAAERMVFYV